jgi:predicted nucleic acid-binding protein
VKAFFDTSVLIATFYAHHLHHQPSIDLLLRFKKDEACCGAHSLAEVYGSLTGRSGRDRMNAAQAMLFLRDIRQRLTIVTLSAHEYFSVVEASAAQGIAGGAIYDAVLGHCALKSNAQTIYTWNTKDFLRLGDAIARRVKTPSIQNGS